MYTINHYTVTFKDWDGTVLSTPSVAYGSAATAPAHPERTGYTSAGWDTAFTNITGDLTVTASYTINNYAITFDAQGGSAIAPTNANYNTTIAVPTAPTLDMFAFSGWYKEPGCVNEWNFTGEVVTGNMTLYARWSNVSTIKVQSSSTKSGTVAGLGNYANDRNATITAIPKNGYYFMKWMNGRTTVSTSAIFTFPAASNMTLKAYFASIPTPRFKVAAIGYNTVKVSWSLFSKATSYEIYRSTSSRTGFTLIGTVGSDVSSYVDTNGLVAGKTYYYKVATVCTAGSTQTSKLSSARSVRPNWPGMTLKAGIINYHTANLSWKSIAEADGYKIFRSTSSRGVFVEIADVAAPTLTYQDAGLSYGSTYYYKILPYDTVGADKITGPMSSARYVRPSWPTLRLKAIATAGSIELSWNAIANADGYEVVRSTSARSGYAVIGDVAATTFVDNAGLTPGVKYYYEVRPNDMVNGEKVYGPYSSYKYTKAI